MPLGPVTVQSVVLSVLGIFAFVAVLFVMSLIAPGRSVAASAGRDGAGYRMNGLALFVVSMIAAMLVQTFGPGLAPLARHIWSLFIAANLLAWPAAFILFLAGREQPRRLAGFFLGVDRSPALAGVDLKLFSYRPSLIGLALMNLSFAALQWEMSGSLSLAMVVYQSFTLIYVASYFVFEHGMVSTWDIIEERFGWMLVWGDYVLVPFFYCLPAPFVAMRADPMAWWEAAVLACAYVFGFWLFRGANGQKHRFKTMPQHPVWGQPPEVLGGRLLASGFWGIGRKLNYTGELIMYVAWTLTCGVQVAVPYLLPAWLAGLLIQRAARDDRRCRRKYGALWDEYCNRVRFRMFPFLY